MTNATKAGIIAGVNTIVAAIISVVVAFGVDLTADQIAAIGGFVTVTVNALLGLWVALTYKNSSKRLPDFPEIE